MVNFFLKDIKQITYENICRKRGFVASKKDI